MRAEIKILLIMGVALLAAAFAFGVGHMLDRRDKRLCPPLNMHCARPPWGYS